MADTREYEPYPDSDPETGDEAPPTGKRRRSAAQEAAFARCRAKRDQIVAEVKRAKQEKLAEEKQAKRKQKEIDRQAMDTWEVDGRPRRHRGRTSDGTNDWEA